ncbi:MAG: DUF2147 domain-containing protein [Ahrensia sp.]|nr:DUF2147 domain-containing protein [Ahrensia sp.]
MTHPIRTLTSCAFLAVGLTFSSLVFSGSAFSAEPIEGNWITEEGETARIAKCGSSFCITIASGQFAGKTIGRMKGSGNRYSGTVTDPRDDKTYSGSARISGASLKLRGCALKIFCKTQNWKR